jgi:epoxyqueuosine reductase
MIKESGKEALSRWIKQRAAELGFAACGIAPARFLEKDARRLEAWLNAGMHGKMGYMANHFDKRVDPRKLLHGAKSVVALLFNYFPSASLPDNDNFILSKYAYGEDYHFVVKEKLFGLIEGLRNEAGAIEARPFVDSAPVLERAWAEEAGLGWVGKHTNLIVPKRGSFFFISVIITDLELAYDAKRNNDFCGDCRLCMDACPTQAIVEPRVVDARKCISYLTIELREAIPEQFKGQFCDRIFGCDICQDVCPWTRFSEPHNEKRFEPHSKLWEMKKQEWAHLSKPLFNELFRRSAVKRTKFDGLIRNINFAGRK